MFVVLPSALYPQKLQWINYTNVDYITSLACYSNIIWMGARGGVIRLDPANLSKKIFTRANGLLSNDVQAVAVGPDGRVWASGIWGNEGIGVFDGTKWSTVATGNFQPIGGVFKMQVGPDGTVWFNMLVGGLWNYKNGTADKILGSDAYIKSFAVDRSGGVWAINGSGVGYYDGTMWTWMDSSNSGLGSNSVSSVLADNLGRTWFCTARGISMYDGASWHEYRIPVSVTSISDLSLSTVDSKGNLWLTYSPWGMTPKILEFDGSRWETFDSTSTNLAPYSRITSSCADSLGNIYFALVPVLMTQSDLAWRGGGQLLTFDGMTWKTIEVHSGTLPFSPIYHFGLAPNGDVWMGSQQNGVVDFNGVSWKTFDSMNSGIYPSNQVNQVVFDATGNPWIVGGSWSVAGSTMGKSYFEGGASHFDGTKWTTYNLTNGNFPSNNLSCVTIDKKGNVWFGTDKGVVKYDGSSLTTYNNLNSPLPSNNVNCCIVDDRNNVWFGTDKGVARFDGVNWTVRNSQNSGLPSDFIWSMAADRTGKLWFLTFMRDSYGNFLGNYLVSYDGSAWNSWNAPSPAHCFCIDSTNSVWVGTYGNGVSRFDGTSWTTFSTANSGIGYNYIEGIMADNHGNLWFGAQDYGGGVSVYNPNGVTDLEKLVQLPLDYRLYQNYPNPFNPFTVIRYQLPMNKHVTLKVYDVLGREVKTLVSEDQTKGSHEVHFNASGLPTGVYLYRLQAGTYHDTQKMILLK